MGIHKHPRTAIDSRGNKQEIVEWQGDHGTAHEHKHSDLEDPAFFSYYELPDGTRLDEVSKTRLRDPATGETYVLTPR